MASHNISLIINYGIICKLHKITDMLKSKDFNNAKRCCPITLPAIQVLGMGLQIVNYKQLTQFIKQTG